MCRPGDQGPYAIGNVVIALCANNTREAWLGRKHSAETRAKISIAAKMDVGRKAPKSAEHRAKISATLKGRVLSPEHRVKTVAAILARKPASAETRARMSAAHKARAARKGGSNA
jgi:hypothetical protein